MKTYSQKFYSTMHERTIYAADTVLSILLERIPPVRSAVDVGCGLGTWLSVLRGRGVDVQGVDGSWVDPNMLAIPHTCFKPVDLGSSVVELPRRYDLAISLEVAEHLPPARATEFVSTLTALSDCVLFSAAVPFQGGTLHVNEQWQHYWVDLFSARNYIVHDFIRPRIWNDAKIPVWYRQNIFLFSTHEKAKEIQSDGAGSGTPAMPLDVVHPDLYLQWAKTPTEDRKNRSWLGGFFNQKVRKAG